MKHEGPIKAMHQFVLAPRRTFAVDMGRDFLDRIIVTRVCHVGFHVGSSSPHFLHLTSLSVHIAHGCVHINTKPESSSCTEMQWLGRSIFFWPENRGAWYCWTALHTSTGTVIHRCVPTHEVPTHEDTRGSNLFWGRC